MTYRPDESNYWQPLGRGRVTRRRLLGAAARVGVGVAGIALVGCGGDEDDEAEPAAVATPPATEEAEEQAAEQAAEQAEPEAEEQAAEQAAEQAEPEAEEAAEEAPAGEGAVVRGGILREGYDRGSERMDPIAALWWDGSSFPAVHETLFTLDGAGNNVPLIAKGWEVSDDGLTWVFTIREGLSFHTGTPINAETVARSLNWTNNPDGGGFVHLFWDPVESITAGPDNTVVIKMAHPFIGFFAVANNGYSTVFDAALWEQLGGDYGLGSEDAGGGPFTLSEYVPGSHLEVARWDGYGGSSLPFHENQGPAYLDGIRWVDVKEPATRAQELEAGNIDALHGPAFSDVRRLMEDGDFNVIENGTWGHFFMGLNHEREALGFNDLRVRQAISHGIDRDAIVQAVFQGFGEPAFSFVPQADLNYDSGTEEFGRFDPALAIQLLDAAGRTGDTRISFSIPTETSAEEVQVAQVVQEFLRDIDVEMNFTPTETVFGDIIEGDIDGYMFENLWHDMIDGTVFWAKGEFIGGCCNGSRANIAEVNNGYDEWKRAATIEERATASRKIQLAAAEQVPFLTLATRSNIWVHHNRVHGWDPLQPNLYPFYQDVWMEA